MSLYAARPGLVMAALLALLLVSPAQARDGWFGADKPGAKSLLYGAIPPAGEPPNAETIYLSLNCADKGKAADGDKSIVVFVSESSEKLKPGKNVRVVLTAAQVNSTTMGKTLPNELAGIPSIEVTYPVTARVFAAMTEKATLRIGAGGWSKTIPLKGLGNRMKTLLETCRK